MDKTNIMMILILCAILFLPVPSGRYKDGGTRTYTALTYKIVRWKKLIGGELDIYEKTSIYWFPNHFKGIEELWELEVGIVTQGL